MAIAALGQDESVLGFGQQLVVFRPTFLGPRFDPVGARAYRIGGEQPQQLSFEGGLLADAQAVPPAARP